MQTVTIINPFSNQIKEHDITHLTQNQVDAYAQIIDDKILDELSGQFDTPQEWLVAYVKLVGPEEAGTIILGS